MLTLCILDDRNMFKYILRTRTQLAFPDDM